MRIFNRAHLPWFIFVVVASVAACLLYLATFYPGRVPLPVRLPRLVGDAPGYVNVGATPLGLIFGSVAFAIFIFAGLLALRKRMAVSRKHTIQRWLRAHIWLTLLTIPLVLLHTGFRLGGSMTTLLIVLYAIVMMSGIYGLILQHYLPALMKDRLSVEPVYGQIPYLRKQLYLAAQKMRNALRVASAGTRPTFPQTAMAPVRATKQIAATTPGEIESSPSPFATEGLAPEASPLDTASERLLLEFLERQALPYLRKRRSQRTRLGNRRYAEDVFRFLRLRVAEPFLGEVEQIESWCDERRMLDYQARLQSRLHRWLIVHVPLSYLLILLTAWHAFVTLFRY
jgi:hypothetical protein